MRERFYHSIYERKRKKKNGRKKKASIDKNSERYYS